MAHFPIFRLLILCHCLSAACLTFAQEKKPALPAPRLNEELLGAMAFRSVGPAFMSGRISDIAVHPKNPSRWYIAVGSGGVWMTDNAGTTFTPVFDKYTSFSIGCLALDPSQPSTLWVGTGENVGGRHVGIGDGIYKSTDGGKSFLPMGLKSSEHISRIIVHPTNSQVVWVAAQGPLWSKGGERGIYKSTDGGITWKQTLGDAEWTGATDLVIDPRNPDVLYAATWQRHRTVAAYLGGGPGSALHKSIDGGNTWTKLTSGLPEGVSGKIGLAISPQQPDVLYAAIEGQRRSGAVYRSADAGASWTQMSATVSGGTGPHYYQELYASPHVFDRIYLMDVRIQVSHDGGKTFQPLKEEYKHSDNHAIAFLPDRPDYLLVGCDGGLYQSHDHGQHWQYFANLPVTQFYDIAIDDTYPFYKIYGGTQDNSTQGGPSRTDKIQGISNSDWSVVLDWDGHQPATEPGNPNVVYAQRQEGTLARVDMRNGEVVDIKPASGKDEPHERYNWDAPILVSPHDPAQLFFASQRLWTSRDRGNSWTALSGDLTRNQARFQLPIMGATQGYDNAWDVLAMSNYNTITMVAESPKQRGLIYVGTDDGLIQITENEGTTWRKIDVSTLPGCPALAYVNDIKADLYDASTAYVALDNHKSGDYSVYLYKTSDKGKTWKSIKGNLPARNWVWRLVQDPVQQNLLFAGTEFGLYVTFNGGQNWVKMNGGLPTISVRDLKIHQRENDLVIATFGRGIYVLDDMAPLRQLSEEWLSADGGILPVRDALWYIPRSYLGFEGQKGDQGAAYFQTPNPDFGALLTYYVREEVKTKKQLRQEKEKDAVAKNLAVSFPAWEEAEKEETEQAVRCIIHIANEKGSLVRKLEVPATKGIHRVAWDLRHAVKDPIVSGSQSGQQGFLVLPGTYQAQLFREVEGSLTQLGNPVVFNVKPMAESGPQSQPLKRVSSFWGEMEASIAESLRLSHELTATQKYGQALRNAWMVTMIQDTSTTKELDDVRMVLLDLQSQLGGEQARARIGEKGSPTIMGRLFDVMRGVSHATSGPTQTNRTTLQLAQQSMQQLDAGIRAQQQRLTETGEKIRQAGGPFVEKGF